MWSLILLEEVSEKLQDPWLSKKFLDMTPKSWTIEKKYDWFHITKFFKFYSKKYPDNRIKNQFYRWGEISSTVHIW